MSEIKEKKKNKTKSNLKAPEKLKLLVTIVNRNKVEFFVDVLTGFEVNMQMIVYGNGTAPKDLDLLGLNHSEKAIIFSFIKESQQKQILETLNDRFYRIRSGKGIAYVMPINSIIGVYLYQFLSNNTESVRR